MGRRGSALALAILVASGCTAESPPPEAGEERGFFGRGEVGDLAGHFRVGCPDGWSFGTTELPGVVVLSMDRGRGGADAAAGLIQEGEFIPVAQEPRTPSALFAKIGSVIGIRILEQRTGTWRGRPAGWARYEIPPRGADIGLYETWWAAVLGDSGWLMFRVDVWSPDVSEADFKEIVDGFEPLRADRDAQVKPASPAPYRPCP